MDKIKIKAGSGVNESYVELFSDMLVLAEAITGKKLDKVEIHCIYNKDNLALGYELRFIKGELNVHPEDMLKSLKFFNYELAKQRINEMQECQKMLDEWK